MTNTATKFAYQLGSLEASLRFFISDLVYDGIIDPKNVEKATNKLQELLDKCEQRAEEYVENNL
jgi:hypothetical protein